MNETKISNLSNHQNFQLAVRANSSSANSFPNSTISQQAIQNSLNLAFNATSNNSQESGKFFEGLIREIINLNQLKDQFLQHLSQLYQNVANLSVFKRDFNNSLLSASFSDNHSIVIEPNSTPSEESTENVGYDSWDELTNKDSLDNFEFPKPNFTSITNGTETINRIVFYD